MESPYYEMTHDFEEENRLFQSGYIKGYHDAVMRCPNIVRCKDCKKCDLPEEEPYENGYCSRCGYVKMDWFCADGERKGGEQDA